MPWPNDRRLPSPVSANYRERTLGKISADTPSPGSSERCVASRCQRLDRRLGHLGMRGTASNDVVIENLFIPDANVAFSRKAGEWHPVFQIIATIAFSLIYAVYLGIAESARDIAITIAKNKPRSDSSLAGRMDRTPGRPTGAPLDARNRRRKRSFGGHGQRGHDRPHAGCSTLDPGGRTCDGAYGRPVVLSLHGTRTTLP